MDLALGRLYAIPQLHATLVNDSRLVAEFWNELAVQERYSEPDITVLYCLVRRPGGETYVILEFVAGETLEDLVRRVDPARCEQLIPLFCQVLDSFDAGRGEKPGACSRVAANSYQCEFGVERVARYSRTKLYGTAMFQPDGTLSEELLSDASAGRSLRLHLVAVYENLVGRRGQPSKTEPPEPVLASPLPEPPPLPAPFVAPPPEPAAEEPERKQGPWRPVIKAATSFAITVTTAALVCLGMFATAGYLAKRTARVSSMTLQAAPAPPSPTSLPVRVNRDPVPPESSKAAAKRAPQAIRRATGAARPQRPPAKVPPVSKTSSTASPQSGDPLAAALSSSGPTRSARILDQRGLQYPQLAVNQKVSGLVRLEVTIAEDGTVQRQRILSGHPLLLAGVTDAVKQWRYEPALVDGKPVPVTQEIEIDFSLNQRQ
ncbi:MAG: TonB family protein [Candidatus Solibacter usitatus]|nr:TonB family protein [Candidatus Solibacter usitatus]